MTNIRKTNPKATNAHLQKTNKNTQKGGFKKKTVFSPVVLPIKKKDQTPNHYFKIIGHITKKGKKNLAKNALDHSLHVTSRVCKISSYKIIDKILKNVNCGMEIQKVTRRKNTTLIPFPASKKRERFLKIKWLLQGAKQNQSRIPFTHKLREEFCKFLEKPMLIKKEEKTMRKLIIKNIANAHYRWTSR